MVGKRTMRHLGNDPLCGEVNDNVKVQAKGVRVGKIVNIPSQKELIEASEEQLFSSTKRCQGCKKWEGTANENTSIVLVRKSWEKKLEKARESWEM